MKIPSHIGKYEIQGILGEGGMGVVYKGLDPVIRRMVAIKAMVKARLDPMRGPGILDRFRNEAQAAGRLLHPGIVALYEYGEDEHIAYLVMELVRGKSLHEHLSHETQYDLNDAWQILSQLLDAIGYSHTQGVVHRDLKPANILINDDGRTKVSDFGIARIDSSRFTELGEVVGTPYYMAPEQVLGGAVDHRADLYAIGIICYQLLTGKRPFTGPPMEVMNQILELMPADPTQINSTLPRDVDLILRKALAKHPEDRFQSARELSDRLRITLEPGVARAPSAIFEAPRAAPGPLPAMRPLSGLMEAARRISFVQPTKELEVEVGFPPEEAVTEIPLKPRILFLDEEERILNALRALFRLHYDVVTTTEGEKALEALQVMAIDVIVSDQRMPRMLGVDVLRRAREVAPDTVRILLTGYSDLASIVGSINEGEIYRFVSKPWDNEELSRILKEAVGVSHALRDMRTAPAPVLAVDGTLLVVEEGREMIGVVRELFGKRHRVLYAPSSEDALDLMVREEVAVLITDIDHQPEQITTMLKLLKQEQPQILTIVATGASDPEVVIELINQAQIYRFINKPVSPTVLKQHLHSAVSRNRAMRQVPELARQQKVESVADIRNSDVGKSILGKLKLLGSGIAGI